VTESALSAGPWDVAVIGGGLAALFVADALADDARVVVLAGDGEPAPASARSLGIVAQGGQDSPARLALALGEAAARSYWNWSGDAVQRLLGRASELELSPGRSGSWRVSLGAEEWGEWQSSAELIRRWAADEGAARTASDEELASLGAGFDGGVYLPADGTLETQALSDALESELGGRASVLRQRATVGQALPDGTKQLLLDSGETLDCQLVVVAAGWSSAGVHPWFRDMLYPVRLQGLRTAPHADRSWDAPVLVRHRFECWLQEPSGCFAFTGCRWAEQPEMEAGVTDDASISNHVDARQRAFLEQHLPGVLDVGVAEQWTGIGSVSCDGLPLVGPIPGDPRIIALCGWGGWGLSLLARASADVAAMALGRGDVATPAFLTPRRML